ncbi:MAG: pilus assembly protein PilM [Bdellovibrionales bacterium]
MKSVGIDIGSYSIKVAEIESSSSTYSITDYYELTFSNDLTKDPYVETIDALRRISSHYDHSTTKFCLALPQASICSRYKVFPFKERYNVLKSIAFELEDDIPYDQDEAIFDAKILATNTRSSEVLAVATPHEHVERLINLCEEAGIDPDIISMESAAVSNLFQKWWLPPVDKNKLQKANEESESSDYSDEEDMSLERSNIGKVKASFHLGHKKTVVSIYTDHAIIATHSIAIGGERIAKDLADKYNISYPEAVKTLKEKGFLLTTKEGANKDQLFFGETIQMALDELVSEAKRFFLSLYSDFDYELESIYLLGGTSRLINLAPYFTQNFEVACNVYDHGITHPQINIERNDSFKHHGCLAVGVAIEGAKQSRNPAINFRQQDLAKQSQFITYVMNKWGTSLQYAAAILLVFFIYAPMKSIFAENLLGDARTALKDEAKKIGKKGRSARKSQLKKYIKTENSKIKNKNRLVGLTKMNSGLDVLDKLSKALPKNNQVRLNVTNLKITDNQVRLTGNIGSPQELSILESALRSISNSGEIKKDTVVKKTPGKVDFAYSLDVNRMGVL